MIPLGQRVFLKPIIEERVGLIWRARMSRVMPQQGIITAISKKGAELTGCKVGDKVIFDRHHQQLSEDEKETVIDAKHLLAVMQ